RPAVERPRSLDPLMRHREADDAPTRLAPHEHPRPQVLPLADVSGLDDQVVSELADDVTDLLTVARDHRVTLHVRHIPRPWRVVTGMTSLPWSFGDHVG